jgi:hypothetical protein
MGIIARSSIGALFVGIMFLAHLGLIVNRIQLVQFSLAMSVEAFVVPVFTWGPFALTICLPEGANGCSITNVFFCRKEYNTHLPIEDVAFGEMSSPRASVLKKNT